LSSATVNGRRHPTRNSTSARCTLGYRSFRPATTPFTRSCASLTSGWLSTASPGDMPGLDKNENYSDTCSSPAGRRRLTLPQLCAARGQFSRRVNRSRARRGACRTSGRDRPPIGRSRRR
jgi:hypothetical protein